ncbi:MAG TPA: hypothetical protein VHF25_07935 [Nitriliruptorales bacterium]|nr:hypothetical protein [Nitriliruptorales bacterium]
MAAVFTLALGRRYVVRGRVNPALLHWTVALALFTVGAAALAWGEAAGWSSASFRVFYLAGAVLTVPWLALGTVESVRRDRVTARTLGVTSLVVAALAGTLAAAVDQPVRFLVAVGLAGLWGLLLLTADGPAMRAGSAVLVGTFTAMAIALVTVATLRGEVPADRLPEGSELFPPVVRGFSFAGNAYGSVLVIVGAVTSAIRLRGRGTPHLLAGNLLIAAGVTTAALGGLFAFAGDTGGHAIAFAVGVTLMYAGFVRTTRSPRVASGPIERPR